MKRLVVGCGYLGLRVARRWVAAGDVVYAVTRRATRAEELQADGLTPVLADVTKPETLSELPAVDTVLLSVGMDRSAYSDIRHVYVDGLRHVLDCLPKSVTHLIYISSTGVYGDFDGQWVDEQSPTQPKREGGKACLEAEQLIQGSDWAQRSTVLRLAGIYGPGRVPTRQQVLSRDWEQLSADGYLNLVHVDDAARVVQRVADSAAAGQTFLVSDGHPPVRRQYYDFIAESLGVGPIPWSPKAVTPAESRASSSKRIGNRKLLDRFDIRFEYPDFRAGLTHAFENSE